MAVGPAGTSNNTNARPQNDGGASSKHVEQFRDAVRSNTSNDAPATQASKGKYASAHLQDTSKSLPVILATRPPINLGNPTGKQGAPLYRSQTPESSQTPSGGRQGAMSVSYEVASSFQEVEDLGARIANGEGPATEADRMEWLQAQQELQQSISDYAAEISRLPPGSPERTAAMEEMARLSDKLTAQELPVLARFDKGFGESWNHFHDKRPGSEGAVLQTRMKIYGITDEQMQRYIATGQEPDGLKRAAKEARRSGDWPALGVVRASYQMRADYLRATTAPDDAASRKQADKLDAASASLTNNRSAIHMNWGTERYSELSRKYPDAATRPANVQKQMDEAKQAIASVRSRAVDQVTAHPERYGKSSPTRQLAGDALTTEARISESEARAKMQSEAKANIESTAQSNKALKPDQPKVVPAPPKLHPDLVEGGAVDQKRAEAVKIDPSLGDIVHGGDRALQFQREGINTKKLRLNVNEQQIAHVSSKGQQPPAELVAKTNTQVEEIFKSTLEANDRLTRQNPASLSVHQTQLLAELNGDATTYAAKISNTAHQKSLLELDSRLKNQSEKAIQRQLDDLNKAYGNFEKAKRDRVETEFKTKLAFRNISMRELADYQNDPAAYLGKQPDSAEEAKLRSVLDTAKAEGAKQLAKAGELSADAQKVLEHSKKIDDLDGLNTPTDLATSLAKDALARSEAHMKALPESGPERLPRLQAAADHQSAVIGLSTVVRDNADARITRHTLNHSLTESVFGEQPAPMIGDDPVANSAENLAKVTAEETETKRGALKDAISAVSETDKIRKNIGTELDKAQASSPKVVREQRAADVHAYKDALALQEVRSHGVVAQLGADIDPKAARAQLEQGSRIINDEMPYTHVSRTDKQQAAMQHSRNEIRAQALADHGDASLAVSQRAQFTGGAEYGMLVVDSLATAHKSAGALKETLTIDGGGAAANTANKELHQELTKRADATVKDALEIDKSADVLKLADSIESELAKDVGDFNKFQGELGKAVEAQRGDAFGIFTNSVARLRGAIDGKGGDLNKIGLEIGNDYLRLGSSRGRVQAAGLTRTAQALRDMHAAGIPDHVIIASLRDPRFSELRPKFFNQDTFEQARADNKKLFDEISGQIKGRYGANLVDEKFLGAGYGIRDTQLGKVFDSARSNQTGNIVAYLGNKNTDLLKEGKEELSEYADMANRDWQKVAPYAAVSQVVDQVVISMASGAALAGVFARAASLTRIPQAFSAARGLAVGMSTPARFAVLAGVNAGEAGLGMLTGAAMGKVGEGIFGEGSTGAKMFGYIGGGFQLSNASKVAMRSGLVFQAGMGLTLGGLPIVAQQLGASPDLAEKLGMASGIFIPTVLGTMSNRGTINRAEHVMVNELGLDPTKARGLMGDLFHAESIRDPRFVKDGAFNVEGFTRDRAAKLVDQKFPGLGENARTQILDNATLDAARGRLNLEPPKNGGVREQVQYIDEFHGRLESELVKMGVKSDRARELAQSEKTAMYDQALAATNAREKGAEGAPHGGGSDPNTPTGAGAATRHKVEELMRGTNQDVQLLNGKPSDLPLKLVVMDKANDRALVKFPDGSMQQVKASEVVYVHNGQGPTPPKPGLGVATSGAPGGGEARKTSVQNPEPQGPTSPKPDLGVPTYGNLPGRVPTAGHRVQIIEKDGRYFERDYETGALTPASGEYAFARMPDGSLWASRYGHAEASMGGRVAYAGQAKFENGALKESSGASGTYRPVGGDFANQAGFKAPPQSVPPHPGKKVQLPVFQEPPGSVVVPQKLDKSLRTRGAGEHDAVQNQSRSGLTRTETSRDLYAEAMKRLPEARKLVAASKAQRGIPDHMLGMATPGGPSSGTQRRMIDLWLAEPRLGHEETQFLMRMLFDEHPVLNDLVAARATPAGPELRAQLNGIMERFAAEAGVSITVVPDGAVQAVRGGNDHASMRSRRGHYEIEQSVYNNDIRLRRELTHQITAYLASRVPEGADWTDWRSPIVGERNAAEQLEVNVFFGGLPEDD